MIRNEALWALFRAVAPWRARGLVRWFLLAQVLFAIAICAFYVAAMIAETEQSVPFRRFSLPLHLYPSFIQTMALVAALLSFPLNLALAASPWLATDRLRDLWLAGIQPRAMIVGIMGPGILAGAVIPGALLASSLFIEAVILTEETTSPRFDVDPFESLLAFLCFASFVALAASASIRYWILHDRLRWTAVFLVAATVLLTAIAGFAVAFGIMAMIESFIPPGGEMLAVFVAFIATLLAGTASLLWRVRRDAEPLLLRGVVEGVHERGFYLGNAAARQGDKALSARIRAEVRRLYPVSWIAAGVLFGMLLVLQALPSIAAAIHRVWDGPRLLGLPGAVACFLACALGVFWRRSGGADAGLVVSGAPFASVVRPLLPMVLVLVAFSQIAPVAMDFGVDYAHEGIAFRISMHCLAAVEAFMIGFTGIVIALACMSLRRNYRIPALAASALLVGAGWLLDSWLGVRQYTSSSAFLLSQRMGTQAQFAGLGFAIILLWCLGDVLQRFFARRVLGAAPGEVIDS